ncbi:uncharacterized protein LOC119692681 isoform X5 [Plutella xylostella]|uniref:uncharacterized protein LOC119692681 isoform X5 n=1 Tax=Plutella xylostella TaxID=51655 RepID=UPI0020327EAC|nr:uncharacterized protein LOC119692681 isoform X5 [Plutella xylostella]
MANNSDKIDNSELKLLIKKRGSCKAQLTQFETFLSRLDGCDGLSELLKTELGIRMKKIELLQSDFDKLQCEIELLSDNVDEAYADRDQFESKLFRLLSVAHGLLAAAARYPAAGAPGGDGTSDAAEECRGGGVGLQRASPGPLPTHRIPAAALLEAILRRVRDLAPAEDEVAHVDGTPTSRIPCLGQGQDATPLDVAHGTDRPATSRQRRSQQSGRHRDQTRHNSTGLQQYLSSTLGLLNTSTAGSLLRLLKLATSVQEEERGERRHHV